MSKSELKKFFKETGFSRHNSPFPGCLGIGYDQFSYDSVFVVLSVKKNKVTVLENGKKKNIILFSNFDNLKYFFFMPGQQLAGKKIYITTKYLDKFNIWRDEKIYKGLKKLIKLCGGIITKKLNSADYYFYSHPSSSGIKEQIERDIKKAKEKNIKTLNFNELANIIRPGKRIKRKK